MSPSTNTCCMCYVQLRSILAATGHFTDRGCKIFCTYGLVISRICSVIYLPRHSNTKARQDTQHAFLIHRSSNLNANILYIILSSSLDPRAVLKSLLINAFGTQMHVSQGRPKTKDFNIALRRNGLDYYYDMYQYKSGHLYHLNSIY